tara:strand:+ start:4085 stop:4222 length:138 start_codon:yes stop_codon:yes gene_type:complete
MAKSQKRSNKEIRKPKMEKKPEPIAVVAGNAVKNAVKSGAPQKHK